MEIFVILKVVPDLVYRLEVDESGKALDKKNLRYIPSDFDDNAIEQALILKEKYKGKITLLAFDAPDIEKHLFVSMAKGVDRVIKLSKDVDTPDAKTLANILASKLKDYSFDILLLGVYAHDDIDGEFGSYLASYLNLPYMGVATNVLMDDSLKNVLVQKAFSGGLQGEYKIQLPAVIGIQSAEKPPRYVNLMKVRQIRKSAVIEEETLPKVELKSDLEILEMTPPAITTQVQMIDGTMDQIAIKLCDILQKEGLL